MSSVDHHASYPECMAKFALVIADVVCALRQAPHRSEWSESEECDLKAFVTDGIAEARSWVKELAPGMIRSSSELCAEYTANVMGTLLASLYSETFVSQSRTELVAEAHRQSFSAEDQNSQMYRDEEDVASQMVDVISKVGELYDELDHLETFGKFPHDAPRPEVGRRPEGGNA